LAWPSCRAEMHVYFLNGNKSLPCSEQENTHPQNELAQRFFRLKPSIKLG